MKASLIENKQGVWSWFWDYDLRTYGNFIWLILSKTMKKPTHRVGSV